MARESCGPSAMDAAASKRMMSITIGLAFVVVVVPVARGPSHSSRCFLLLTRTTVCCRAVRHYGGALRNTIPGRRRRLR